VVDAQGIPLVVQLTGAHVHDSMVFAQLLDAIPALKGCGPGRPRSRPDKLHADKGYDYPTCRRACHARGIRPRIARRGMESKTRLGRHRWVVERTFSWWNRQRRLVIRYDRCAAHYEGFLHLACALICWNYLMRF
jgi:transposase